MTVNGLEATDHVLQHVTEGGMEKRRKHRTHKICWGFYNRHVALRHVVYILSAHCK